MKTQLLIAALLFLAGLSAAEAQTLKADVTEESLTADLRMSVCGNGERLEAVRSLFRKMGASDSDLVVSEKGGAKNLTITKKGKSPGTVVVSAHYDKVGEGCGVIDNWTGVVIVANLYRAMKDLQTEKTYIFAAFDKEERGLVGAAAMAQAIPKAQRASYCSMVNFDSFGFAYPQVLANASNPKMIKFAEAAAEGVKMPFHQASLAGTADADSSAFNKVDIPAITFHGLSNDWQKYLHTSRDTIDNIKPSSVRVGYYFALMFLNKLDALSCDSFRK